jgi:hypothetical protein
MVDAVAIRPMRSVAIATAVSRVSGSRYPQGRRPTSRYRTGPSDRNSESNAARPERNQT